MDEAVAKKIEYFFTRYKEQVYKKGELLIRADDAPAGIYYLTEGRVKKYAISQKGEEVILNIFKPIAFFPMNWAVNGNDNHYYFEALSDVSVWRAPREDVVAFIKREPDVLFDLMQRVYRGTDGMEMRMAYLMAGSAYTRLVTELIISTKRFGKKDGKHITLEMTEPDLAAQTGMTRETISREIRKLKEKGIIQILKNKLVITDLSALEADVHEGV
jgi:CRP-like cAMP-binding protein